MSGATKSVLDKKHNNVYALYLMEHAQQNLRQAWARCESQEIARDIQDLIDSELHNLIEQQRWWAKRDNEEFVQLESWTKGRPRVLFGRDASPESLARWRAAQEEEE